MAGRPGRRSCSAACERGATVTTGVALARPTGFLGRAQFGQGLIEYALILSLIAIVTVVSLFFFGDQLSALLSMISSAA